MILEGWNLLQKVIVNVLVNDFVFCFLRAYSMTYILYSAYTLRASFSAILEGVETWT